VQFRICLGIRVINSFFGLLVVMPPINLRLRSSKLTSVLLQVFWNSSDSFFHVSCTSNNYFWLNRCHFGYPRTINSFFGLFVVMPPFNLQLTSSKLTFILLQVFWNSYDSFLHVWHVWLTSVFLQVFWNSYDSFFHVSCTSNNYFRVNRCHFGYPRVPPIVRFWSVGGDATNQHAT
jgi:hypothetical protein